MPPDYSVGLALTVIVFLILSVACFLFVRKRSRGDSAATGEGEGRTAEEKVKSPPPPPRKYRITIFDSGDPVKSFISSQVSSGTGKGYAIQEGHKDWTQFSGTYVIEPENSATETPRTAACKWHVQLFCGNKAVREWYATQVSSGDAKLYVLPEGATEWTTVGGTFFAEPVVAQ